MSRSLPTRLRLAPLLPILGVLTLAGAACTRTPELVLEHMKRGDAALAEGRFAQALVAYGHARELSPHDPAVQKARMRARVWQMAETAPPLGPQDRDEVRYEAELLLDTDKERAAIYLTAIGTLLAEQRDVEGAKAKLGEALRADPASPVAHTALGMVWMTAKDGYVRAGPEFEAALRTKPEHGKALFGLGLVKLAAGDAAGAAERLEAALRVDDDHDTRIALGRALMQQEKSEAAVEHFRRASLMDPKSVAALTGLGQALLGAKKPEEAERALRAALQIRADLVASTALGVALLRQGKSESAIAVFEEVLDQDATSANALYGAAQASEALGRREKAVEYYQRVVLLQGEGLADLKKTADSRMAMLVVSLMAGPSPAPGKPLAGGPPGAVR